MQYKFEDLVKDVTGAGSPFGLQSLWPDKAKAAIADLLARLQALEAKSAVPK